ATYTVQAGDTGLAGVSISATDAAGNITTTPVTGTVTIDTAAPTVTPGTESSDNANSSSLAKASDVISATFSASDTVTGVTIGGHAAVVTDHLDGTYTATYTVQAGDASGTASVVVSQTDAAGNTSAPSILGTVTIDTVAPTVTLGSESTNNSHNAWLAALGNVITETFTSTDPVTGATIGGHTATVHDLGGGDYTATYTVQAGDGGWAGVSITATDAAGNATTTLEHGLITMWDGSGPLVLTGVVTMDTLPPTITHVSDLSNNPHTDWAKAGDVITESFTLDPAELGVPVYVDSVTIDGNAATVNHVGDQYTATYTVQSGDLNLLAGIQIDAHDGAGNTASVTLTGDVMVDTIAPTVAVDGATETSNNANSNLLAKAGDVITETFTSTDIVSGVTIDGRHATVVDNGSGNYTATYTVQSGIHQGTANIVVTSHDIAGNITVLGSTGAVTVDTIAPDVGIITPAVGIIPNQVQTLLGYGEAGTPIQIFENGTLLGATTVANNGRWTQIVTLDNRGLNTLTVTDTDPTGNIGVAILPYDVEPPHGLSTSQSLQQTVVKGSSQSVWQNLLAGAVDQDATGSSLAVSDLVFSVNGGASSANVPGGLTLNGNQLFINPNSAAFAGVTNGHPETIIAHYAISDGHGGKIGQTDTIMVVAPINAAVANDHAPVVASALHTTVVKGGQAVWDQLLAGASDVDGNTLHATDVTFSINGGAYSATVPAGLQISNDQVLVDPNNAAFAGLTTGQSETIVVHYNVNDGLGGTVAQTDTVMILGPAASPAVVNNHAPTIQAPLHTEVTVGLSAVWDRLLVGASDQDAGNILHVQDVTFSINGGAYSATTPAGITISNDQILVDPNNGAFAGIGAGQSETIVVHYNVTDGLGGSVAQTDTITILGQAADHATHDHAPTVAAPLASTVVVGAQPSWTSLTAGASDVDGDYLSVTNLTYSVNGGAFSASAPAGVQAANGMILVNQNDAAYAGLAYGQSTTIVAHYNISDGRGGLVAQSDTITVTGHAPTGAAAVVNHAPTVDAALGEIYTVGLQPVWDRLLAGASDSDGNTLHATDLTYSINGGAASATTPAGIQVANDMISLDPNNAAFAGLATGQHETIVVGYNVNDGHGGLTHQTDTLTVQGPLANPAAANVSVP
ncbi:MAG: Ig-like domain-containing protein, partial [Burkholderiales bacterium]